MKSFNRQLINQFNHRFLKNRHFISNNTTIGSYNNFNKKFFSNMIKVQLSYPDTRKNTLEIETDKTLNEFEEKIKKLRHVEHIQFKTWDNALVSKTNTIDMTLLNNKEPIFLKLDRMEWQELHVHSENHQKISNNLNKNESISEKEQIISTLRSINKNSSLTPKDLEEMEVKITQIKHYYNNILENKILDSNKYLNLNSVFKDLNKMKKEYSIMNSLYKRFKKSSDRNSLLIILLGSLFFILELIFVYMFTFEYYSWDITEPMTYLVTCFNVFVILLLKKKFGGLNAHEFFSMKFMSRKMKSNNFNQFKYEQLKKNILELENKLN